MHSDNSTKRLLLRENQFGDDGLAQHKEQSGSRAGQCRKCSIPDSLEYLQEISALPEKKGTQLSVLCAGEDVFRESAMLRNGIREERLAPDEISCKIVLPFSEKELSGNKDMLQVSSELSYLENEFFLGSKQPKCNIACQKKMMPTSGFNGEISQSFKYPAVIFEGDKRRTHLNVIASGSHTKNVVVIGVIMTLLFVGVSSLTQGQAILDDTSVAGLISLAVGFTLGSVASFLILQTHQLRSVIFSCLMLNLFGLCSYIYPIAWLIVLLSLIQGITTAFLCNSISSYITLMSRGEAHTKGKHFKHISGLFFGFFFAIFQNHQTISSLSTSMLFNYLPSLNHYRVSTIYNNNTDYVMFGDYQPGSKDMESLSKTLLFNMCGPNFNSEGSAGLRASSQDQPSYIVCVFYFTCVALSILITTCLLKPACTKHLYNSNIRFVERIKLQTVSFLHLFRTRDFLLMFPLLIYSLMQFGFLLSDVTMAYVSCPLDAVTLSYTMACFGICASISSFISGLISECIGRASLLTFAAVLNVVELLFLSEWTPSADSLIPYFAVVGIWGSAHGIWMTQVYYLVGVLFPERYEAAYAGMGVAQGLGVAVVAGLSSGVSTLTKIYIMLFSCIFALSLYIAMEILLRQKHQRSQERKQRKKSAIYTKA